MLASGARTAGGGAALAFGRGSFKVGGELGEGARGAQPHEAVTVCPRTAPRGAFAREVGHGAERRRVHARIITLRAIMHQPVMAGTGGAIAAGIGAWGEGSAIEKRGIFGGVASGLAEAMNVKGMCHEHW